MKSVMLVRELQCQDIPDLEARKLNPIPKTPSVKQKKTTTAGGDIPHIGTIDKSLIPRKERRLSSEGVTQTRGFTVRSIEELAEIVEARN